MSIQPVHRELTLEVDLNPIKQISHVAVQKITMQPNVVGGPHMHAEPLFGVILSGAATLQVAGKAEQALQPGDTFYEPAGATIDHFSTGSEGVVFLAYSLLGSEEEPRITMLDKA